jgi:hypothetical protein
MAALRLVVSETIPGNFTQSAGGVLGLDFPSDVWGSTGR